MSTFSQHAFLPRAFKLLLLVQFLSALADNAFLIVAIARVMELGGSGWLIPVLKIGFTVFYVVLAPFVGPLADALPKGRVMVLANVLKVGATALLLLGLDPVAAIALAGLGAAIYAPAKYGLITEILTSRALVQANGYFEGVTVSAVILGTVVGGFLISPLMQHGTPYLMPLIDVMPATTLLAGMLALLAMYLLAMMLSIGIRDSGARYERHSIHPWKLMQSFVKENAALWRDSLGGLSMAVTSLMWAVGATLQLIVLRWAQDALGLPLEQAAYLQGVTALGVVAGALLASRRVGLEQAQSLLPLGVLIGLMVPTLLWVQSAWMAAVLLLVTGAMAGFFVVPMNALLQHRGATLLTAGRSIAVQGFNENGGMLLMLVGYAAAIRINISLHTLILGFGLLVTSGMALIWWRSRPRAT
jgi:MFS family permease